jgi:hypothetical protein
MGNEEPGSFGRKVLLFLHIAHDVPARLEISVSAGADDGARTHDFFVGKPRDSARENLRKTTFLRVMIWRAG